MDISHPDCQLVLIKCCHLTQIRLLLLPSTSSLIHCSLIILTRFQASATKSMGSVLLFWKITQRRVVTPYRSFGTTYWSHLQRSRILLDNTDPRHTLHLHESWSRHYPQHSNCISSASSSSKSKLTFSKYDLDFLFNPPPKYPRYSLCCRCDGHSIL